MNRKVRSIGLALLAVIFIAAGAGSSYAQAGCDDVDAINALYNKVLENYKNNATVKVAVDSGKEFLEKFGTCEPNKQNTDWIKSQMAKWEERATRQAFNDKMGPFFKRFDAGITSDNADEVFAAGKEILVAKPGDLNIMVPMAMSGILQSYKNNPKYADESLRLSKEIIAKLKGGAELTKKNPQGVPTVGVLKLEFTKDEAIEELSYGTAYMTYWVKKDKKTALPLYYEFSQGSGKYKSEPRVYATIGEYYVEEAGKLGAEIASMIEKQKAMATDEEKEKIDVDIKAKVGLFNGYTERAIDAFARAHKVAPSETAAEKTFKDELYKRVQDLYKRRFDKDSAMANLNTYVATSIAKPFPNPTSEVTPINDPEPTTTTTGVGAATGTGVGAASGNGVGAASGNGVGMAGSKPVSTTTTTAAKPAAPKKPR